MHAPTFPLRISAPVLALLLGGAAGHAGAVCPLPSDVPDASLKFSRTSDLTPGAEPLNHQLKV